VSEILCEQNEYIPDYDRRSPRKWLLTRQLHEHAIIIAGEKIHAVRTVRGKSSSANREFAASMIVGYSRRSTSPKFTLLTCSVSRGPRRRGACRSLRNGGDCCPTNWNWPSHRSYSRPAPGPDDGPSPEIYIRPSRSLGSIVSSQEFGSIAARSLGNRPLFIASRHRLCCECPRHPRADFFVDFVAVTVARVATCDRAALIRIENALLGPSSTRDTRTSTTSPRDSTRQEYIPTLLVRSSFLSLSLSLSI